MSCDRYRDALTDVAAGGPATPKVEAHLATCEACRRELAALRQALSLADSEVARLATAEPSPGLPARIREAVAESSPRPEWRFGWVWPMTAATASLLVALAIWMGRPPSPARVAVETRPAVAPGEGRPAEEGSRAIEAPERTASSPPARAFAPAREGFHAATVGHPRRPAPGPVAPEVLVPQGEAEALVRFAGIVSRELHTPGAFATTGRPSPALAEPAELVIKPLEIVPLDPAETPGT